VELRGSGADLCRRGGGVAELLNTGGDECLKAGCGSSERLEAGCRLPLKTVFHNQDPNRTRYRDLGIPTRSLLETALSHQIHGYSKPNKNLLVQNRLPKVAIAVAASGQVRSIFPSHL
jgi:hypothetical protein